MFEREKIALQKKKKSYVMRKISILPFFKFWKDNPTLNINITRVTIFLYEQ